MIKTSAFAMLGPFCASLVLTSSIATAAAPSTEPPRLSRAVVMSGLENPWDIAFTPDGVMLFTEKCRGLSARLPDGKTVRLFGTRGSTLVAPDLFFQAQSGMHGVAVDPDFAKGKRDIYVFMASNQSMTASNRVVRLSLEAGGTAVSRRTDIITDIAYKQNSNGAGAAGAHSGGVVRFGPDGFLWVTTGDNHNATLPQDLKRLGEKCCAWTARVPPRLATKLRAVVTLASSPTVIETFRASRSGRQDSQTLARLSPPNTDQTTATK